MTSGIRGNRSEFQAEPIAIGVELRMYRSKLHIEEVEMKDSPLMLTAKILTIAWLLVGVVLFWWLYPPKLSMSDVGSFSQGLFAPLAFFWFIVTVYLQRQQLTDQKAEFENSRRVMAAQVEEAKRQADLLQQQTAMLKDQDESRRKAAAAISLREIEDLMETTIRSHLPEFMWPRQNLENRPLHFRAVADTRAALFTDLSNVLDEATANAILPHSGREAIKHLHDLSVEYVDTLNKVDGLELYKGATPSAFKLAHSLTVFYEADPGKL